MVAEKCRTPANRDCVEAAEDLAKVLTEEEKVEEELLAQRGALLVRYRPREAVRSAPRATMDDMMGVYGFVRECRTPHRRDEWRVDLGEGRYV
jgi:hypothetical protein